VYGGAEYSPETFRNGVWTYSWSDNTWSRLSDISPPPARYAHTAISTSSSMLVYGGVIEGQTVGQYDCLWQFSYESQSWTNTQDCQDSEGDVEASLYGSAVLDQCRKRILFYGLLVYPFYQYGLEA
ncbi:gefF, partial [Symbiodinium sp. CCMP2456]